MHENVCVCMCVGVHVYACVWGVCVCVHNYDS